MFIVGDDYFGRVDHAPGLFYVKTRFLHVWWFPFVPRESYLFIEEKPAAGGRRGVRIPLRWKSVWIAWMRAGLLFGCLSLLVAGGALLKLDHTRTPYVATAWFWGLALFCAGAIWLTYRGTRVDLGRAIELGELLGMKPEEVEQRFYRTHSENVESSTHVENHASGSGSDRH